MASHKFFLCRVPSTLSQQTFVLGVSSSQRRSYGLMQLEYRSKKPILPSDPLSAQLRPRGLSIPPWTILPACSVNPMRLPRASPVVSQVAGQAVIKPLSFVDKEGSKAKSACAASPWQLDVFVSNFTGSAEWSSRRSADETKVCVELPQNYFYQVARE